MNAADIVYVLDRFEGTKAVIEKTKGDETVYFTADRITVGSDVREGDVLTERNGFYIKNEKETETKKGQLSQRLKALKSRK